MSTEATRRLHSFTLGSVSPLVLASKLKARIPPARAWVVVPLVTWGWYLSFGADYTFGTRQGAPGWVLLIRAIFVRTVSGKSWQNAFREGLCSGWLGGF